jgi:hypothetical protein
MALTINSDYFINRINRFVFAMETEHIFCDVETEILNIIYKNSRLEK